MNNERRKILEGAVQELNKAKDVLDAVNWSEINDWLNSAKSAVEQVRDEEEEAFENLSEGLQQTENGQRMDEVRGELDEVATGIEEISEVVEKIMEQTIQDLADDIEGAMT